MHVVNFSPLVSKQALDLLNRFKETSIFLLGNLEKYGPVPTEHPRSGQYKCIMDCDEVVGVFCLTRTGMILAQSNRRVDITHIILNECEKEQPICAFNGAWEVIEPVYSTYKSKHKNYSDGFFSKEILFKLDLNDSNRIEGAGRFLNEKDFEEWNFLNLDYLAGEKLAVDGSTEQRRASFFEKVKQKHWWGLNENNRLVSIAGFNACFQDVGQLGGIYTPPEMRGRGLARKCVEKLIYDSIHVHNLSRLILFTGNDNIAAQRLYRSVGFTEIGNYALIFGSHTPPF